MTTKRFTAISAIMLLLALFISCASKPAEVPADATVEQLIQLAQESYDNGNTAAAIEYYEAMLSRYGNSSTETYIIAQYEIAHILVKEGKEAEAKHRIADLLSRFDDEETARSLPAEYRKLAENELSRMDAAKK